MSHLYEYNKNGIHYCCYSERGAMSYYMFQELCLGKENILIKSINQSNNQLFDIHKIKKFTIFSELDLGNKGFGKPDGAVFFIYKGEKKFIFIEAKINKSYKKSNNKSISYNSTLNGQIELKYRFSFALKNNKPMDRVIESKEFRKEYDKDRYKKQRQVIIKDGVQKVIKYIDQCTLNNIYYLIITQDEINPIHNREQDIPKFYKNEELQKNILWINQKEIVQFHNGT